MCPGDFQSPNNRGLHFLSVSLQASNIPGSLLSAAWKPLPHLQGTAAPTPSFHVELGMQPFTHLQQTGSVLFLYCQTKRVHEYTHTCFQISAISKRESLQSHNMDLLSPGQAQRKDRAFLSQLSHCKQVYFSRSI